MQNNTKSTVKANPRFVWNIGAIYQLFPDLPEQTEAGIVLWDRQEKCPVVTIHDKYAQAVCLEACDSQPFTDLEDWFCSLSNECLESEGMTASKPEYTALP